MWEQGSYLAGGDMAQPTSSWFAAPSLLPFSSPAVDSSLLQYCDVGGGGGAVGGLELPLPPIDPAMVAPKGTFGPMAALFGSLQAELGRMTAREMTDAKALAASRSHSEAERRRRQRINSHLARLRSLLPNTTKTDKASLLAEVIEHVKELKRQTSAMMVSEFDQQLPTEADELIVEPEHDGGGRFTARATLCCEDRPDLIPELAGALRAIKFRTRRAEITTLGGRVRNVLIIDSSDVDAGDEPGGRHERIAAIQEALRAVIDRKAAAQTADSPSPPSSSASKRQRMISYAAGAGDQLSPPL